jgi:hypothetical protein
MYDRRSNQAYLRKYGLDNPAFPPPPTFVAKSRDRNQERRRALAPLDTANLNSRPTTEFYTKPYNRWEGAGKGLVNFGHPMYLTYQDAKGQYHVVPNHHMSYYTYSEDYLGKSLRYYEVMMLIG